MHGIAPSGNGTAEPGCKCPACLESERRERKLAVPYRHAPGPVLAVSHLALQVSLPLLGMFLIGRSWPALAPALGFVAAYLLNSLFLCSTCAYHHGDAKLCGCFPKSVFSFKRYRGRPWGLRENLAGWPLYVLLAIGPAAAVLGRRGAWLSLVLLVVWQIAVLYLMSTFSCPACRQRSFCWLGRLTIAGIRRKDL